MIPNKTKNIMFSLIKSVWYDKQSTNKIKYEWIVFKEIFYIQQINSYESKENKKKAIT